MNSRTIFPPTLPRKIQFFNWKPKRTTTFNLFGFSLSVLSRVLFTISTICQRTYYTLVPFPKPKIFVKSNISRWTRTLGSCNSSVFIGFPKNFTFLFFAIFKFSRRVFSILRYFYKMFFLKTFSTLKFSKTS